MKTLNIVLGFFCACALPAAAFGAEPAAAAKPASPVVIKGGSGDDPIKVQTNPKATDGGGIFSTPVLVELAGGKSFYVVKQGDAHRATAAKDGKVALPNGEVTTKSHFSVTVHDGLVTGVRDAAGKVVPIERLAPSN